MHTLTIDFETEYRKGLSLKSMTLRKYLASTKITGLAFSIDHEPATFLDGDQLAAADLSAFREIAESDEWCVVAHNAAFDIRVWRLMLGLPQPRTVFCSLELACAAFPCHAGGYSLGHLATTLPLGGLKHKVDLKTSAGEELAAYCRQDCELARNLFYLCVSRLPAEELRIAAGCNRVRELAFTIAPDAVASAYEGFTCLANESAAEAAAILGEGGDDAFGMEASGFDDEGQPVFQAKSVRTAKLKDMLLDRLGFQVQSISAKKLNPEKLRANPQAAAVLAATSVANKAFSHQRRVKVFAGSDRIDVELGYYRATATGRFSSPQAGGRGLNLHNLSKRQPEVAKLIRSMFRLSPDLCMVRADLANVEYRIEGMLTGCEHTARVFTANPLADPYLAFGNEATGRVWTKKDPIRQVFKAAVLGLGYLMSSHRFAAELLKSVADPTFKVSLDDLRRVCADMKWLWSSVPPYVKAAVTQLRCPQEFGIVAHSMRERFHELHPEFARTARWIEQAVARLCNALDPDEALEQLYDLHNAPPRELIDLRWEGDHYGPGTKSVSVRCGRWPHPTVVWRDLAMRECLVFGKPGVALTAMHQRFGFRPLTKNIYIENIIQSASRNALCAAKLELEETYPWQLSVHDELMLIVPRDAGCVLQAKADMLRVLGPGNQLGYNWAVLVNPKEINVSQSLYEVELGDEWWQQLSAGKTSLLESLP